MTADDLAELKRRRDRYREVWSGSRTTTIGPLTKMRARRDLETILIEHADALIAAAEVCMPDQERSA